MMEKKNLDSESCKPQTSYLNTQGRLHIPRRKKKGRLHIRNRLLLQENLLHNT
jgi:hypothetical protein